MSQDLQPSLRKRHLSMIAIAGVYMFRSERKREREIQMAIAANK